MMLFATKRYEQAAKVNQHIIALEPTNVQAHFNAALLKKERGDYQAALNNLISIANGNIAATLNNDVVRKSVNREIRNMVALRKKDINTTALDPKYLNNVRYDVRMVFEWNDPSHEFEIQFVNPQKRFFNWEHTNAANAARIKDELRNGYTMEEFEFYGKEVKGKWIINAKYLGSLSDNLKDDLVLKCTLYQRFGEANQIKEEIIIHFKERNAKKNVKTLIVK